MLQLFIYPSTRPLSICTQVCLSVRRPGNRALNVTVSSNCTGRKQACSDRKQPALRPAGPNKISGNVRHCRRYRRYTDRCSLSEHHAYGSLNCDWREQNEQYRHIQNANTIFAYRFDSCGYRTYW